MIWLIVARLMILAGIFCGALGLIIGATNRIWKLGSVGWFTGGTLLAVLAIAILVDDYLDRQRQISES
jgi:hypothetical protein